MEEETSVASQPFTPPAAPLPPGSRKKRATSVVDTSSVTAEPTIADSQPEQVPSFVADRSGYYGRLSEGSARALATAESAHRLAQNLQAVIDVFDTEKIDPSMLPYVQANIDQLYETATRLNQLVSLVASISSSEWRIYQAIYPSLDEMSQGR